MLSVHVPIVKFMESNNTFFGHLDAQDMPVVIDPANARVIINEVQTDSEY